MKPIDSRVGSLIVFVLAGATLGACASATDTPWAELEKEGDPEEAQLGETLQSAPLLPPPDYTVKWSTCTHYVEGSAPLPNNTRVVTQASDGTLPLLRVEPLGDPETDVRRIAATELPSGLIGGEGVLRQRTVVGGEVHAAVAAQSGAPIDEELHVADVKVSFLQLGQVVTTEEADGTVQWNISSEDLGEPVQNPNGKLEYQDTCFRNPNSVGRDTLGYIAPSTELAISCLVESLGHGYNSYSAYGYLPLMNFATTIVPSANDPARRPLPEIYATYLGFDGVSHNYTGLGAALNDINGAERDSVGEYYGFDIYCHMIVSGGLEVPGAKRPATKSLPAPGVVSPNTLIVWRPVNASVTVANDYEVR
jgi:hypothetical protein